LEFYIGLYRYKNGIYNLNYVAMWSYMGAGYIRFIGLMYFGV